MNSVLDLDRTNFSSISSVLHGKDLKEKDGHPILCWQRSRDSETHSNSADMASYFKRRGFASPCSANPNWLNNSDRIQTLKTLSVRSISNNWKREVGGAR